MSTSRLVKKRAPDGFTFIELLVVITIVGIVFASGVVAYTALTIRSRDARRKADLESIRQAVEMCRSLTGAYPATIYETNSSLSCAGVAGPVLMSKTPLDPRPCNIALSGQYSYTRLTATTYTLIAPCMENDIGYQVTNP